MNLIFYLASFVNESMVREMGQIKYKHSYV